MFNDFKYMLQQFGVNVILNDETKTRKAIISSETQSKNLPNFDYRKVSTDWVIKRGDIITIDGVIYLVISDIQLKRGTGQYKAMLQPMTNILLYTYETGGYYEEVDPYGNPIYIEEPVNVTDEMICIAIQDNAPQINGGQIATLDSRVKVIMQDNPSTQRININDNCVIENHTYKIQDVNLLQSGLRVFALEWGI